MAFLEWLWSTLFQLPAKVLADKVENLKWSPVSGGVGYFITANSKWQG